MKKEKFWSVFRGKNDKILFVKKDILFQKNNFFITNQLNYHPCWMKNSDQKGKNESRG